MPANASIYLPASRVNLAKIFEHVESDKTGLLGRATYFDVRLDGDVVRFPIMPAEDVQEHLQGLMNYVASVGGEAEHLELIQRIVPRVSTVLGLLTDKEFEDNDAIWQSIFHIARAYDGLVFVHDSFMLGDGTVLVSPHGGGAPEGGGLAPEWVDLDEGGLQLLDAQTHTYDLQAHRERITPQLKRIGFAFADWLPHQKQATLRPLGEIARRLLAIKCLMAWVCLPKEKVSAQTVRDAIQTNRLGRSFAQDEAEMLKARRAEAHERFVDHIGWKFENAWPLAWVLGFDPPPDVTGVMMEGERIRAVLSQFAPPFDTHIDAWLTQQSPRSEKEVVLLEDTLYCVHNAARSATLGHPGNVPAGFHPNMNGGVIQERRHALTWALSPDAAWDDTDLST